VLIRREITRYWPSRHRGKTAVVKLLVAARAYRLLAIVFARATKERTPDGRQVSRWRHQQGRPTVLALLGESFRGDPEILAADGRLRVLELSAEWLRRLVYCFYDRRTSWRQIVNPDGDSKQLRSKSRYRSFLAAFLPILYRRIGADCVISPHIHFGLDFDWGAVSQELRVPYVVLHRENLYASPALLKRIRERLSLLKFSFEGDSIVVHNEIARRHLIECGVAPADRVVTLGAIRMDRFLRRIAALPDNEAPHRRLTFFPFNLVGGTGGTFPPDMARDYFDRVAVTITRFAMNNSGIEVVIKPKSDAEDEWRRNFRLALTAASIDPKTIPNLVISSKPDAQNLILRSDVVVGINSTTLIEAGVARRYVIVPHFDEVRTEYYDQRILYRDAFEGLLVARSPEELTTLMQTGLDTRRLPEPYYSAYRALFEKYVSPLTPTAQDEYVAHFSSVIRGSRGKNG